MSSQVRVILDDNAGDIQYGGGEWTLSTLVQWYQGTSNYPAFVGNGSFGSFTLAFAGTSVAFIGNTPDLRFSQSATVSIDGGVPHNIIYPSDSSYIQWYQSPILSDGRHTIAVDHLDGTAVDMAIIGVGPATPLVNRKIFVDNNSPEIQYAGQWTENDQPFRAGSLPDGPPIGNSTQRSTSIGDIMTFRFSGTSISVYGIFSWTNIGSISVAYTLDGAVEMQSYSVTENSPQHISGDGEATNFLFFDRESIPTGSHTLIMNITDIENQTFIFDYLVYSPSFSSLATMPNLTSGPLAVGPTSPAITSVSSTSNTSPSSNSSITTQTGVGGSQGNHKASETPVGVIVGAAIGGILLVGLMIVLILYLRNQSSNRRRAPSARPGLPLSAYDNTYPQMSDLSVVRSTFGRSASSREDVTPFYINPTPAIFASVFDIKRSRMEQDPPREGVSTSLDIVQRNNLPPNMNAAPTVDIGGLEYLSSQSVPPAYEALPTCPDSRDPPEITSLR